jgi:hypothetical protein
MMVGAGVSKFGDKMANGDLFSAPSFSSLFRPKLLESAAP